MPYFHRPHSGTHCVYPPPPPMRGPTLIRPTRYAVDRYHSYCDGKWLDWTRRSSLIQEELSNYDSDLVFLQVGQWSGRALTCGDIPPLEPLTCNKRDMNRQEKLQPARAFSIWLLVKHKSCGIIILVYTNLYTCLCQSRQVSHFPALLYIFDDHLQEVEGRAFRDDFEPFFSSRGFNGWFQGRNVSALSPACVVQHVTKVSIYMLTPPHTAHLHRCSVR